MAINWSALNLGFGKSRESGDVSLEPTHTITDVIGKAARSPMPILGEMSFRKQMRIFAGLIGLLVIAIGFSGYLSVKNANNGTAYVSAAGQLRTLSQQISNEVQQALQGQTPAFQRLREARKQFSGIQQTLSAGGDIGGAEVPPTRGQARIELDTLGTVWLKTDKDISLVLDQQANLVALGEAVRKINSNNASLLDQAEAVAGIKLEAKGSARAELEMSSQLVMLTQRMAKNANALLASDEIGAEVVFLLRKDKDTFRNTLNNLKNGNVSMGVPATTDPDALDALKDLEAAFAEYSVAVDAIMGNLQPLVNAKRAGRRVVSESDTLLGSAKRLEEQYQAQLGGTLYNVVIGASILLVIASIILLGKAYRDETERRRVEQVKLREESERLREEAEAQNKANQEAILRLMNEMGSLADGDLTVQATVTEDITGAIADSVNYTIEELRVLVGRINSAAAQVTSATESAAQTSTRLLQAAERQSKEIQTAGDSVQGMARAINDVSASASQSVNVARQSLTAAQKGQEAVQNSIAGMNDIRDQIQETAKRIKRLGESSQEIGEIVELITDITEQTNVLALNAAIQAASAGEAGRGFTVVAEEVQRLAERSGEATKQIGAIVKTIQTDTQDAVSAMEKSTQGVVDGAKLSDAAGQALGEIGDVSRRLAQLIEDISVTAQAQAQEAGTVATTMQDILSVTKQTTEGTKQTAVSVGQLAKLAAELKGSVANFKI
ncbi:MAG TPA: methyl-accepting chemotaxis protein [Burkholderiales bacterium]|nr:methyl-accepting chemotaxis protein [Burkholderiales bacterium]